MKTAFLVLASLAVLGCAQTASQGSSSSDAGYSLRAPTDEGSSSSISCLQDPNCK